MTDRDEAEAAAAPSTAPGPSTDSSARPAPEFGEYAPEGWSWTPDAGAAVENAGGDASPQPASDTRPSSGRVPGVPHNLGAGGSPAQPTTGGRRAPAAQAPVDSSAPRSSEHQDQHYRGQPQPSVPKQRVGDRVVTIMLLVLGAFGALYFATSLQQLPGTLSLLAGAFEVDGFTVPAAVQTLGTVGALIVFAIYAITLIFSIQRMRRRKLTFWVPLVAGVVAFIVAFAFTAFGMAQAPELASHLADPDASSKLLDYLSGISSSTP